QEARSLVATRGSQTWNERLNVLCEEGSDLLVLDVYDYIGVGREQIVGSATLELKHLLMGDFSDEWNEYSLRVDKESGAMVTFRCCFKPFVSISRYGHASGSSRSQTPRRPPPGTEKPRDIFGFE